jgi:hypothetical protein
MEVTRLNVQARLAGLRFIRDSAITQIGTEGDLSGAPTPSPDGRLPLASAGSADSIVDSASAADMRSPRRGRGHV